MDYTFQIGSMFNLQQQESNVTTDFASLTLDTVPTPPEGKIYRKEYSELRHLERSTTFIKQAPGANLHRRPMVTMFSATRGFAEAGSCMVWREACISVHWESDGAGQGRNFAADDMDSAEAYFVRLTVESEETRERDRSAAALQARFDDCAMRAESVPVDCAKAVYRNKWSWRVPSMPGLREWSGYGATKAQALREARNAIAHALYDIA